MTLTETDKEILQSLLVDDAAKTVTITRQLDRKQYQRTNELLETAGGTWSRKAKAHVFTVTPSDALKVFISGETATVTTTLETKKEKKKTYQAFYTPDKLADELVSVAELAFPYAPPDRILEPSAGNGQLVKALFRKWPSVTVDVCEIQDDCRKELVLIEPKCCIMDSDFLKYQTENRYELILANPPFQKHQDIEHVRHMHELLAKDGVLIAVTSQHWRFATHKIDVAFREWLKDLDAEVYEIPSGAFKESGTMVSANYVVIRK